LFEAQQRRRRQEQYRRVGYPPPARPEFGDRAARAAEEVPTLVSAVQASEARPVRLRLVALSGDKRGEYVELRMGRLRIGRDPNNEIRLADLSVSHFHAIIAVGKEGATIEDLGSTNHTYVNDELIEYPRELAHGDTIRLGHVTLLLQEER
jgi:predicted component of type VI protein secretion system